MQFFCLFEFGHNLYVVFYMFCEQQYFGCCPRFIVRYLTLGQRAFLSLTLSMTVREKSFWHTLHANYEAFLCTELHCLVTRGNVGDLRVKRLR